MPIFNTPKPPTIRSRELGMKDGMKVLQQELEDKSIKIGDLKIIGWAPFSSVCSYTFVDVTEWYRSLKIKPDVRQEIKPYIVYHDIGDGAGFFDK
jgi:hypothetical protein